MLLRWQGLYVYLYPYRSVVLLCCCAPHAMYFAGEMTMSCTGARRASSVQNCTYCSTTVLMLYGYQYDNDDGRGGFFSRPRARRLILLSGLLPPSRG